MALIQAQLVNPPAGGRTGGVRAGANITIAADGTISSTGGGGGGLTGLQEIDDISGSFNGATVAFPITISGGLPIPAGPGTSQLVIALGGITQTPGDAFTFDNATDTITFTAAPPAGVSFAGWIGGDAGGVSSVTAGAGLTGGGTGAVTLAVGAGTGITVGAGTVGLAPTGVIAGAYTTANITVDAQGRLTAASNGTVPTPGNGTIQISQGGVSKGSFTVNQAGNTTIDVDSPGPGGGIQAWANLNGFTLPVTLRRSGNISSVTRISAGIYQFSMITAASTSDYAIAGTCSQNGDIPGDNYVGSLPISASTFQAGSINNTGASFEDAIQFMVTLSYT